MRFSELWLREWINPKLNLQTLKEKFTMAGLEVESIETVMGKMSEVVVASVSSVKPHPDSKLTICQVTTGKDTLQIVCGASNVQAGQKVVLAKVGAKLPHTHETIKEADFKGVASQGMLLSLAELGLAEKSEGIYVLHESAPVGMNIVDYLHLDDHLIELDLTPNRGDCLSIQGIARELHTLTKATLHPVRIEHIKPQLDDTFPITIEDKEACPRYCGRIIRNVDCSQPTPDWMKEKLRRSDIRSINAVVDVMNYVMIELGQPMHAFDFSKLEKEIKVRKAMEGESIKLLDGQTVTLKPNTLLIADSEKPLAMAGVMGGDDTAVTTHTRDLFLESAFFKPELIAGKGRQYGLHTDSSARFERGVDPNLQSLAIERATQWIIDICGGRPCPVIDCQTDFMPKQATIPFSADRARTLLGFDVADKAMLQIFERLGCAIEQGSVWQVTPPSYRFDLAIEEDLVEEIARCLGYDTIPMAYPQVELKPKADKGFGFLRIKQALLDEGYQEAITYSFVDPALQKVLFPESNGIALSNPIASDLSEMRLSLWPGLLKALQYNVHRQQNHVFLFETGLTFQNTEKGLIQEPKVGGVCYGSLHDEHWSGKPKTVDFFDVKGHLERLWTLNRKDLSHIRWEPVEHPALHTYQAAQMFYKDKPVGLLGALHPSIEKFLGIKGPIYVFELKVKAVLTPKAIKYIKPSLYPSIRRDISMIIDKTIRADVLCDWIKSEAGKLLKQLVVFDLYQGQNIAATHKSMALGLIWQDPNRTLVDHEIDGIMQELIQGLEQRFKAQLRE